MSQESLAKLLADLHAERVRSWDPAALKINVDQRATLVETADPAAWIKVGDSVEPFVLQDVEGGELTLKGLTAKGPVVLIFFRFAGCPARWAAAGVAAWRISTSSPERVIGFFCRASMMKRA